MLPTYAFYLALMAVLSSPVMAAPMDTLSSIQCHCLTFYTYSAPATCALPHSQNLSWDAAQSFASANKLDITFASQMSISRVLEVERPLPTSVLMTLYGGLSRGRSGRSEVGSRVVCGSWDEVTKKYVSGAKEMEVVRPSSRPSRIRTKTRARKCDGLISEIVGFFVVFIVLYAALEFVWSRLVRFLNDARPVLACRTPYFFFIAICPLLTQSSQILSKTRPDPTRRR